MIEWEIRDDSGKAKKVLSCGETLLFEGKELAERFIASLLSSDVLEPKAQHKLNLT